MIPVSYRNVVLRPNTTSNRSVSKTDLITVSISMSGPYCGISIGRNCQSARTWEFVDLRKKSNNRATFLIYFQSNVMLKMQFYSQTSNLYCIWTAMMQNKYGNFILFIIYWVTFQLILKAFINHSCSMEVCLTLAVSLGPA